MTTYEAGDGGWLRAGGAFVRFADQGKRLVATTVVIGGAEGLPIDTDALRSVPLGRLEAWANGPGAKALRAGLDRPGPDPAAALGQAIPAPTRPSRPRSGRKHLGTFDVTVLEVPTAPGDKGDAFYRQVADIYKDAASAGAAPLVAIVMAAGGGLADPREPGLPPRSTVQRWIRECRRRDFLPPGRKGKAG